MRNGESGFTTMPSFVRPSLPPFFVKKYTHPPCKKINGSEQTIPCKKITIQCKNFYTLFYIAVGVAQ